MLQVLKTDSYKLHHREQYPAGIQRAYSTLTARNFKFFDKQYELQNKIMFGGVYIVKRLQKQWKENFADVTWGKAESELKNFATHTKFDIESIIPSYKELHEWMNNHNGNLPLEFRVLQDYEVITPNTALIEIINTEPKFFWLVNYIETELLSEFWPIITSANIAKAMREMIMPFAVRTTDDTSFTEYQLHDFSQRGLSSTESAIKTGLGHLAFSSGTDNLPASYEYITHASDFKGGDTKVPASVIATEHAVMCLGANENTLEDKQKIDEEKLTQLLKTHPTGVLSVVADGFDFYNYESKVLANHKEQILARDGKLVIRPDSGDVMKILFGDPEPDQLLDDADKEAARLGLLANLDKIFGHTTNSKGFKELNSHIGMIYGDAITFTRGKAILSELEKRGWASNNIVLGIGAFTYQYITRDTLSIAMKSSAYEIDGKWIYSQKTPITDRNKKSLKGFTKYNPESHSTIDNLTYEQWAELPETAESVRLGGKKIMWITNGSTDFDKPEQWFEYQIISYYKSGYTRTEKLKFHNDGQVFCTAEARFSKPNVEYVNVYKFKDGWNQIKHYDKDRSYKNR